MWIDHNRRRSIGDRSSAFFLSKYWLPILFSCNRLSFASLSLSKNRLPCVFISNYRLSFFSFKISAVFCFLSHNIDYLLLFLAKCGFFYLNINSLLFSLQSTIFYFILSKYRLSLVVSYQSSDLLWNFLAFGSLLFLSFIISVALVFFF